MAVGVSVAGVGARELGLADAAQAGDGAHDGDARARRAQRGHQVFAGLEGGRGLRDVARHDRAARLPVGEEVDLDVAAADLDTLAAGYVHRAGRPGVRVRVRVVADGRLSDTGVHPPPPIPARTSSPWHGQHRSVSARDRTVRAIVGKNLRD
jgi:hypothetical protein